MRRYPREVIEELIDRALDAGLASKSRTLLLSTLPEAIVRNLPRQSTPADQLRSDIHTLAAISSPDDADAPLHIWARQAAALCRDLEREQSAAIEALVGGLPAPRPAQTSLVKLKPLPWLIGLSAIGAVVVLIAFLSQSREDICASLGADVRLAAEKSDRIQWKTRSFKDDPQDEQDRYTRLQKRTYRTIREMCATMQAQGCVVEGTCSWHNGWADVWPNHAYDP